MGKFETMLMSGSPISDICRATFCQACHICERIECCDNTNPLVKRIKELEAALNTIESAKPAHNSRVMPCPHFFNNTDGVHCVLIDRCNHPDREQWRART